jgi:hypothetical protein
VGCASAASNEVVSHQFSVLRQERPATLQREHPDLNTERTADLGEQVRATCLMVPLLLFVAPDPRVG